MEDIARHEGNIYVCSLNTRSKFVDWEERERRFTNWKDQFSLEFPINLQTTTVWECRFTHW